MDRIVELLALVVAGPMVGAEFGVAAFTNPIFGRLPDEAFRQARSNGSRMLGRVMPFWYVATLAVLIATAVITSNWLVISAVALMALVVPLTVTVLVPVNNRIGAWSEEADVSRDLARRWDRLHWLRVVLLTVMFVTLVAGTR